MQSDEIEWLSARAGVFFVLSPRRSALGFRFGVLGISLVLFHVCGQRRRGVGIHVYRSNGTARERARTFLCGFAARQPRGLLLSIY